MPLSTIVMPCNDSGFHSVEEASAYGLVSYDWSNAKQLWCNARPMGDGELLVKQAEMVRQASTTTRIGVCKGAHTIYCHAMCPLAAEPALQPTSRPFLPSARTAVLPAASVGLGSLVHTPCACCGVAAVTVVGAVVVRSQTATRSKPSTGSPKSVTSWTTLDMPGGSSSSRTTAARRRTTATPRPCRRAPTRSAPSS